uniref:BTB domain-containing protein n=1 Tax=Glossina brevipalpis TaxID=37001 RepID=A0A1A9W710_9MUSC
MGEIKSVKVDNWGVFFLQKLQNFFNKTDYCDLTLQFRDNSQLKVHRLVLSACTDYFNVLEQTCEVVDDAIIMPNELQADVVVPIVNFMYTGTLEFELKMYNRLLRTARDMNMTVLLKLLEAHRRTMELHPQKVQGNSSPKLKRRVVQAPGSQYKKEPIASGPSRVVSSTSNTPIVTQRRLIPVNTSAGGRVNQTGGTSAGNIVTTVTRPGISNSSAFNTKIKQEVDCDVSTITNTYTTMKMSSQHPPQSKQSSATSPFEQLRKGYNNNKRPATATFVSPPAKKPNLEDVKEFAEQQRMRKQIAAEYGEADADYDGGLMDDDIHNDDDDDDVATNSTLTASTSAATSSAAVQTTNEKQLSDDPPGTTTITVKHEGPDKPPTIVVKDTSNSKMNHAKIISEVLRQYPHLVKSNKNIKLKIIPNAGGSNTQKIIVKKEPIETERSPKATASTSSVLQTKTNVTSSTNQPAHLKPDRLASTLISKSSAAPQKNVAHHAISSSSAGFAKATTVAAASSTSGATPSTSSGVSASAQTQKRRIDSKTMHALIALGAENTTGPWLCLRCGRNGHPISIPSYRGFRRHLINTHKESIDAALCEYCGWRSSSKRELHFHMQLEHKIKTNLYIFPECQLCAQMCIDSDGLNQHLIDSHPEENKQQCIYCNKIFPEEMQLYTHMKTFHKKQALEDGIIDQSDDEATPEYLSHVNQEILEEMAQVVEEKKIKILSDISLPTAGTMAESEASPVAISESKTADTATTSTTEEYISGENETKFVAADGTEMILTEEQRKEILSQLNQEHEGGGVVMVFNEPQSEQLSSLSQDETSQATTATTTNEEAVEHDDSHIFHEMKSQTGSVLEAEEAEGEEEPDTIRGETEEDVEEETYEHNKSGHLDESKESLDNLEWAENLITEHEMANTNNKQENYENDEEDEEREDEEKEEKDKTDLKELEEDKAFTQPQRDDISKKLKELTGDWSDDDNEDVEMHEEEEIVEENTKDQKETQETALKYQYDDDHIQTNKGAVESEVKGEEKDVESPKEDEEENLKRDVEAELTQEEDGDDEPMVEDDIDLALKSLHKDNEDTEENIAKERTEKRLEDSVDKDVDATLKSFNKLEEDDETLNKKTIDSKKVDVKLKITDELDEETKKNLIEMLITDIETAPTTTSAIITSPKTTTTQEIKCEETDDVETEHKKHTSEDEENKNDDFPVDIEEKSKDNEMTSKSVKENLIKFKEDSEENTVAAKIVDSSTPNNPVKDNSVPSTEDRVKSLISEWGDDDDDDDANEEDLTKNL